MSNDIQTLMLRFEQIIPTDEQIIALYELLKLRSHRISHLNSPSFSEHSNFIINNPYRAWFLLRFDDRYIGSIYATLENSLGVNILDSYFDCCLQPVIDKVIYELDPLPPVPTVRAGYFSINVPFSIKVMSAKLEAIGFTPTQNTRRFLSKFM
jgi:hypothetical protein